MLSYTLLTVAVKCFILIFYIFYFDCDKFGSKGSFFFQNKKKQKYRIKELRRIEPSLTNKGGRYFPPTAFLPALSRPQQLQVLELKSGRCTGTTG